MQGVWSMVAFACAQPSAEAPGDDVRGAEALAIATRMVDEIGPRPSGSPGSRAALDWVEHELSVRGWAPERWIGRRPDGAEDGVLACEGEGPVVLFFAHVDSVHARVPGANDNAAAVGALLELASRVEPVSRRVCLAFPDGEELGLLGSRFLRDEGRLKDVDQVVALDLVAHGQVTHNGLGPSWTAEDARALLDAAPADVPWVYRAISHAIPRMERSDHGPWGLHGVPASHILARGESGVYWAYHTRDDTLDQLELDTLGEVVGMLEGIAHSPALRSGQVQGEPWFVVPWTGRWADALGGAWVVSGGWTVFLLGFGPLVGLLLSLSGLARRSVVGWRSRMVEGARDLGRSAAPLLVGAAVLGLAALHRPFGADRALPVVSSAWLALIATSAAVGPKTAGPGVLVALVGAAIVGALSLGAPLLALPGALALLGMGWTVAVGSRSDHRSLQTRLLCVPGALLAAWPALYLLRPAAIRETAFHGLLPAHALIWMPMWLVLVLPVAVAWPMVLGPSTSSDPRRRAGVGVLAALALLCVAWAWVVRD